jgi:hypothetical protein
MTRMNLKPAIPLILSALALVPAAVLASQTQVRQQAFSTEGRALVASRRVMVNETPADPTESVAVIPIEIRAPRPRPLAASAATARAGCADWRSLRSGPSARAADGRMVRACEGAPTGGSDVPTPDRRSARAATERPRFDFVVDLSAPR